MRRPYIEDGERVAVKVLGAMPCRGGFAVAYQLDAGDERVALLPLPRPVGSDLIQAGRHCRLELLDNGTRILAVHPLVS